VVSKTSRATTAANGWFARKKPYQKGKICALENIDSHPNKVKYPGIAHYTFNQH